MKKSSFAVLLAVLPMAFISPCHSVYGQSGRSVANTPQGYLTPPQAKTFQSALHAISARAHICVLAEASPIKNDLTAAQAKYISEANTLEEALARVASAYDYSIEGWYGRNPAKARRATAPTLYLFRKKYTDAQDLPDVTFDECRLLFSDVDAMVKKYRSFPPITSNTNGTLDVAEVLTPEQLKKMAIGDGIPIRDLRPEQQKIVRRLAMYSYVDLNVGALPDAAPYLGRAEEKGVVVQEKMPLHPYDQQWPVGTPVYAVKLPDDTTGPLRDIFFRFAPCCSVRPFQMETTEAAGRANENPVPPRRSDTLGNIFNEYAHRAPNLQIGLDNAIANRHVSQFGSTFAAPVDQVYALSSLLDMQLQHRADTEYRLSRPRPRDPRDVSQLFQIIRGSLFPGSLRRYFNLGPAIDPNRRPDDPLPPMPSPPEGQTRAAMARDSRATTATNVVREAMRPLLRQALAQEKDGSPHLKFSALDENAKGLFGLLWVLDRMTPFMSQLPVETPGYISHFQEISLRGGWHGEEPKRFFDANFVYHPSPGVTTGAGFRVGSKRFKE